jgi:hypothetical protein
LEVVLVVEAMEAAKVKELEVALEEEAVVVAEKVEEVVLVVEPEVDLVEVMESEVV